MIVLKSQRMVGSGSWRAFCFIRLFRAAIVVASQPPLKASFFRNIQRDTAKRRSKGLLPSAQNKSPTAPGNRSVLGRYRHSLNPSKINNANSRDLFYLLNQALRNIVFACLTFGGWPFLVLQCAQNRSLLTGSESAGPARPWPSI